MISKSRDARLKIIPWSFRHDDSVHFAPIEFPSTAMDPLTISQVAKLAGASGFSGDTSVRVNKVSTDSRTLKPGELFVALRGQNFDGHNFVELVANTGAAGAILDSNWSGKVREDFALIRAKDTLKAYQELAANYRRSLTLSVVAITGSNGKTSTKDFTAAVLARRFRVTKTEGNFNNHVGLPRTMLEATSQDEVAVWEIGMNHPGEVAALAQLAAPDVAIITNIGVAHIEFMGSREKIAEEKGALAEAVGANGRVILNADDSFTKTIAARARGKVILAGITAGMIRADEISQSGTGTDFTILEGAHRCRAQLPVPGLHMVQNALLAVAAGRIFGVSLEDCAAGLTAAPLTKARLQIKDIAGVQFLDDSYNANPDSMKAALRTLVELDADGKRIAVLGEMLELGEESERGHREVGETAAALKIDKLIAIGDVAAVIAYGARRAGLQSTAVVKSTSEAAELLSQMVQPGDLVLIKGSRAARTEEVIGHFALCYSLAAPQRREGGPFVTSP
ncbi:MAG: UDP-N-acetylmuramoyl-tripeptide--D-alanyl-D-alanine ligase [Verrucomicrobia bacterium]|nr:MAG: UDP-N-acetylmuramoyl-tripeptide--D-alanyl-D-alanine ligase [Verrucomicrobiota bacterium]